MSKLLDYECPCLGGELVAPCYRWDDEATHACDCYYAANPGIPS